MSKFIILAALLSKSKLDGNVVGVKTVAFHGKEHTAPIAVQEWMGVQTMACKYCKGGKQLYQANSCASIYLNHFAMQRTLEVECSLCPPYADCCMKDIPVRFVFLINYCPNCGERLAEENAYELPL